MFLKQDMVLRSIKMQLNIEQKCMKTLNNAIKFSNEIVLSNLVTEMINRPLTMVLSHSPTCDLWTYVIYISPLIYSIHEHYCAAHFHTSLLYMLI